MKVSPSKRQEAYKAIADPIMDARVWLRQNPNASEEEVDQKLHDLTELQWGGVVTALNIEDNDG